MIPYLPQPVWKAGPFTIHAFGIAAAAAIIAGYLAALFIARSRGLDSAVTGRIYVAGAIAGLAVSAAGAVVFRGEMSVAALAAGSLAVAGYFLWKDRAAALRHLDALALAFPIAWALVRAGCFFTHDHIGAPSASLLAVQFPGGSRLDLGLIESLAATATGAVLWLFSRLQPAPGFLFAGLLIAAGITRAAIRAVTP